MFGNEIGFLCLGGKSSSEHVTEIFVRRKQNIFIWSVMYAIIEQEALSKLRGKYMTQILHLGRSTVEPCFTFTEIYPIYHYTHRHSFFSKFFLEVAIARAKE